jgi:hypothetical protein
LGANIAQISPQTSTTGVEFMDPALNELIVALTSIHDQAESADNVGNRLWRTSSNRTEIAGFVLISVLT